MKNYYEILEVDKNVSPDILKKVFKIKIKMYHPDLYKGDKEEAEKITSELNNAYETLSDHIKRSNYDNELSQMLEQQYIDEENRESLLFENSMLKSQLIKKQQIIDHFLAGLDLSEFQEDIQYNNEYENVEEFKQGYQNTSDKNMQDDYKKYYINVILSFLSKIIGLILVFVFILIFLSILNGQNFFSIIFNAFK